MPEKNEEKIVKEYDAESLTEGHYSSKCSSLILPDIQLCHVNHLCFMYQYLWSMKACKRTFML